jgi:polyhydroxybutyrate depolymerase
MERDKRTRQFYLYRPERTKGSPAPVVFVNHGGGGQARFMRRFGFEPVAEREGFVIVYPQGWNGGFSDGRRGSLILARAQGADDLGFFRAMIEGLVAEGLADPTRIYSTGMSNGAIMSFLIACNLPVAAIATQVGAMSRDFADTCKPARPVPLFMINGTKDPFLLYGGGIIAGDRNRGISMSVDATIDVWRRLDHCTNRVTVRELPDTNLADGTTTTEYVWTNCSQPAQIRLFRINGGGHYWHGMAAPNPWLIKHFGKISQDFNGAQVIWAFFRQFSREP